MIRSRCASDRGGVVVEAAAAVAALAIPGVSSAHKQQPGRRPRRCSAVIPTMNRTARSTPTSANDKPNRHRVLLPTRPRRVFLQSGRGTRARLINRLCSRSESYRQPSTRAIPARRCRLTQPVPEPALPLRSPPPTFTKGSRERGTFMGVMIAAVATTASASLPLVERWLWIRPRGGEPSTCVAGSRVEGGG
jgi:hypothetical protein